MRPDEFFKHLRDIRAGEVQSRKTKRAQRAPGSPSIKVPSPLRGTKQRWSTHGISFHRTRDAAIREDVTGDAQRGLVEPQLVYLRGGEIVA